MSDLLRHSGLLVFYKIFPRKREWWCQPNVRVSVCVCCVCACVCVSLCAYVRTCVCVCLLSFVLCYAEAAASRVTRMYRPTGLAMQ